MQEWFISGRAAARVRLGLSPSENAAPRQPNHLAPIFLKRIMLMGYWANPLRHLNPLHFAVSKDGWTFLVPHHTPLGFMCQLFGCSLQCLE